MQAVGEVERAGEGQGRVFTEAQAGRGDAVFGGRRVAGLQRFEGSQPGDVEGRLGDVRRVEAFGRAVDANAQQIEPEHVGGLVEQPAGRRQPVAQVLGHADRLGALAGEQ
jgi:hypothetical protein